MTAEVLWEQFRAASGRDPAPAPPQVEEPRRFLPAFLVSGETWLTFALVLAAFMAVAHSIESANWVREMPSLVVAGLVGLVTGWLLAHLRLPPLALQLAAVASGAAVAVGLTMHTMRLEDPLLRSGMRARWDEMWARTGEWLRALAEGGISADPLPFVLMVVFGVWAMSYLGSWSVFRWRNAWLALILAGFAMLTNISYLPGQPAQEFIVFLFASILLVTRLHYLRALNEWRRQRTWRAPYLSLEVLSFATWMGLALILVAWIVPTANNWGPLANAWVDVLRPVSDRVDRVGRLFIGVGSRYDRHVHNFAGTLPLRGKVTLDGDDVLLRVVAPEPLYLRGAVYDQYTAQGWKVSDAATQPLLGTSVEAATFGTPETRAQVRRPISVEITVERSVSSRRLFTVGDPLAADVEARLLVGGAGEDPIGLVPDSRVRDGDSYSTVGAVSAASLERLLASGRDYPPVVLERYLALPDDLPPEVRELAVAIAGEQQQPYAVARRVELFLRREYPFDLRIPNPPPRRDRVAYFLFDVKRGYFDHHASAMAVLLRTLGIPARVATGFALDEADLDSESKAYLVTESRAWTWPEVYFEGLGWVEFNPTPAQPLISRPGEDLALFGSSAVATDEAFTLWELLEFFAEEDGGPAAGPVSSRVDGGGAGGAGTVVARALTWLSLAALALFAVWAGSLGLWSYWFRALSPAASRWARLEQLAVWAGVSLRPHLTPLERAERVGVVVGGDLDVRPLACAYTRERYGAPDVQAEEPDEEEAERLSQLYVDARNRLLRRIVRRRLRLRGGRLAGREPAAPAA